MPARRDTQMEASRLRFLSPLQTVEDQSLVWGIRCHSCTGREGLPPSWKLSYKAFGFAIYPRTSVLFRSTGRTELQTLLCHSPMGNAPSGVVDAIRRSPLHRSSNREVDSSYASPCIPLNCRKRSYCEFRRRGKASRRCLCPGEHHPLELFCLSCRALRINDLQRKVSKLLDKSKVLTIARYNSGSNRATAEGNQDIIEQA
jgi:hypothetical protein